MPVVVVIGGRVVVVGGRVVVVVGGRVVVVVVGGRVVVVVGGRVVVLVGGSVVDVVGGVVVGAGALDRWERGLEAVVPHAAVATTKAAASTWTRVIGTVGLPSYRP